MRNSKRGITAITYQRGITAVIGVRSVSCQNTPQKSGEFWPVPEFRTYWLELGSQSSRGRAPRPFGCLYTLSARLWESLKHGILVSLCTLVGVAAGLPSRVVAYRNLIVHSAGLKPKLSIIRLNYITRSILPAAKYSVI